MRCRTESADCFGIKDESRRRYREEETRETAFAASRLIDNGRAGTLSRVEEVLEYCKDMGYKRIGVAYCFGLKTLVTSFIQLLKENGFDALPVSCTAGGVKEREIDETKTVETVSCNPAGQALVMNRLKPELVIEIGLCLGHDIIFHRQLEIPHTVLVVKDRVYGHAPASYFKEPPEGETGSEKMIDGGTGEIANAVTFLEEMDDTFRMRSPDWLEEMLSFGTAVNIVDVRPKSAYDKSHIKFSINIPLRELPARFAELEKETPAVFVCNGSVMSAYALSFLAMKGYRELYNLSGGFSRWSREEREIEGIES
jgi:uncharacterized metal-binding protein/rhodanese-related sulfurtransferase